MDPTIYVIWLLINKPITCSFHLQWGYSGNWPIRVRWIWVSKSPSDQDSRNCLKIINKISFPFRTLSPVSDHISFLPCIQIFPDTLFSDCVTVYKNSDTAVTIAPQRPYVIVDTFRSLLSHFLTSLFICVRSNWLTEWLTSISFRTYLIILSSNEWIQF